MALKTDYKEDILASGNTRRKYNMITNDDGTVSFEDVTEYEQTGDTFGASDINSTNKAFNALADTLASNKKIYGITIYDPVENNTQDLQDWTQDITIPDGATNVIPFFTTLTIPYSIDNSHYLNLRYEEKVLRIQNKNVAFQVGVLFTD